MPGLASQPTPCIRGPGGLVVVLIDMSTQECPVVWAHHVDQADTVNTTFAISLVNLSSKTAMDNAWQPLCRVEVLVVLPQRICKGRCFRFRAWLWGTDSRRWFEGACAACLHRDHAPYLSRDAPRWNHSPEAELGEAPAQCFQVVLGSSLAVQIVVGGGGRLSHVWTSWWSQSNLVAPSPPCEPR